jgi:glycine cleavage system H protein
MTRTDLPPDLPRPAARTHPIFTVAAAILLMLLLVPLLTALAWTARIVLAVSLPIALVAVLASPTARRWLAGDPLPELAYRGLRLPIDRRHQLLRNHRLHQHHTWLRTHGRRADLGIDDLVQRSLGPVDRVSYLALPGSRVKIGTPLVRLNSGARNLTVRSPIDGRLQTYNPALAGHESRINSEPYGRGWLAELRRDSAQAAATRQGAEARSWFEGEVDRLLGYDGLGSPAYAQDGGVAIPALHEALDDATWMAIRRDFFGNGSAP